MVVYGDTGQVGRGCSGGGSGGGGAAGSGRNGSNLNLGSLGRGAGGSDGHGHDGNLSRGGCHWGRRGRRRGESSSSSFYSGSDGVVVFNGDDVGHNIDHDIDLAAAQRASQGHGDAGEQHNGRLHLCCSIRMVQKRAEAVSMVSWVVRSMSDLREQ